MGNLQSGLAIRLEIHVDAESVLNDGPALGACLCDLEREGWWPDTYEVLDGGGIKAVLTRCWNLSAIRLTSQPRGVDMATIQGGES